MRQGRTWMMFGALALGMLGWTAGLAQAGPKETRMVVEYVRYEVPPAQREQFIAAYRAAAKDLEASGHCLGYEISEGVEEPDHFIVRIEWDSVEGHEQGFRTSAPFAAFFAKVKPFFGQIREMKHYRVLQAGQGAAAK